MFSPTPLLMVPESTGTRISSDAESENREQISSVSLCVSVRGTRVQVSVCQVRGTRVQVSDIL